MLIPPSGQMSVDARTRSRRTRRGEPGVPPRLRARPDWRRARSRATMRHARSAIALGDRRARHSPSASSRSTSRATTPATGSRARPRSRGRRPARRRLGADRGRRRRRGCGGPESRFGPLLAAAGFAWFLPEWNNPGVGSALAFTVGLVPVRRLPAARRARGARLPARPARLALERSRSSLAYAARRPRARAAAGAVLRPAGASGCYAVPAQPRRSSPIGRARATTSRASASTSALVWALALAVLVRSRGSGSARPSPRLVLAAGAVYLGARRRDVRASSLERGFLSNGDARAAALARPGGRARRVARRASPGAGSARRRAASDVARLVVELAQSPPPGGLRDVLAEIVGDPRLVLAYPLEDSDRLVDAHGRAGRAPAGAGAHDASCGTAARSPCSRTRPGCSTTSSSSTR